MKNIVFPRGEKIKYLKWKQEREHLSPTNKLHFSLKYHHLTVFY